MRVGGRSARRPSFAAAPQDSSAVRAKFMFHQRPVDLCSRSGAAKFFPDVRGSGTSASAFCIRTISADSKNGFAPVHPECDTSHQDRRSASHIANREITAGHPPRPAAKGRAWTLPPDDFVQRAFGQPATRVVILPPKMFRARGTGAGHPALAYNPAWPAGQRFAVVRQLQRAHGGIASRTTSSVLIGSFR